MRARPFLLAALCLAALPADACHLRMAPESWPPYIYSGANGVLAGADVELAQAILREAGCTIEFVAELPSLRREILFRQGKLDLMLAASKTEERRRYARFSSPYRQEHVRLFAAPDKVQKFAGIDSFDAIARQRIAVLAPRAGWYGADYARAAAATDAGMWRNTFGNFQQGIQMFRAGRAELIMGDAAALEHAARQQGITLAALPYVPFSAPVHLMLNASSTTQDQLARINSAIARLEHSGALATIRTRYGLH
ncbi:transporter substrate-binding domain-containing protein [Duganella ginsengisoli]|uniref:Transporter substrate-binding domain-containing protein n=2 Tax=Pseudoduganella ginsengisoli TaxID=1462440 RepID=A0A6L6Q6A2_9BURK|nr:transporter substrate-binding domain-containing protein [Pseudoduganella ginsengisoli]